MPTIKSGKQPHPIKPLLESPHSFLTHKTHIDLHRPQKTTTTGGLLSIPSTTTTTTTTFHQFSDLIHSGQKLLQLQTHQTLTSQDSQQSDLHHHLSVSNLDLFQLWCFLFYFKKKQFKRFAMR